MHYYLIDPSQFDGKNFEFHQTQLFSLLNEYQIAGETARVTRLRSIKDLVGTALGHGAKTLVVVGSDETLSNVIGLCRNKAVTLGFIPLNSQSEVGKIIGASGLENSVAALAKRRIEELDLVSANDKYIFSNIVFGPLPELTGSVIGKSPGLTSLWRLEPVATELKIDGAYKINVPLVAGAIINARSKRTCPQAKFEPALCNPKDGRLDVVLAGQISKYQAWRYRRSLSQQCYENIPGVTVIRAKKVEIRQPAGMNIFLSGRPAFTSPLKLEVVKERVRIVVSRERQF